MMSRYTSFHINKLYRLYAILVRTHEKVAPCGSLTLMPVE